MRHNVLWRSNESVTFEVVGESLQPFSATANPVITNSHDGTTVGLEYRDALDFGYWSSSICCGPVTA
jgi:hypothetical protein